jgi:hypothetical protein
MPQIKVFHIQWYNDSKQWLAVSWPKYSIRGSLGKWLVGRKVLEGVTIVAFLDLASASSNFWMEAMGGAMISQRWKPGFLPSTLGTYLTRKEVEKS